MLKRLFQFLTIGVLCAAFGSKAVLSQGLVAPAETKPAAQAYLYLQPFDARVEALFRLPMMLQWLGLPVDAEAAVTAQDQAKIRTATADLVANWCSLTVDDVPISGSLVTIGFFKGEPSKSMVIGPNDALTANEMLIGLVWEFPIHAGPEVIDIKWTKFLPPLEVIPLTAYFGKETEALELYVKLPVAHWLNKGRLPHPRPPAEVPAFVESKVIEVPVAFLCALLLGFFVHAWMKIRGRKYPGGFMPFFMAWLFGLFISLNMFVVEIPNPTSPHAEPITTTEQADAILSPLLHNLYRAFDLNQESTTRDILQRSIDKPLLAQVTKETTEALTLPGPEGMRVQVTELAVEIDKVMPEGRGFTADAEWTTLGLRSHWGHKDSQANRFKAKLSVQPINGMWKIHELNIIEQRKL